MQEASHDEKIAVLREMIRIAETRRTEELEHIDRVNRHNLALIGFSGSFLSLLITVDLPLHIVQIAGSLLLSSVCCSLIAIMPRKLSASIFIEKDVEHYRYGYAYALHAYLLDIAGLQEKHATVLMEFSAKKKFWTILSAIFLAAALFITYVLFVYA